MSENDESTDAQIAEASTAEAPTAEAGLSEAPELRLYHFPGCVYCHVVRRVAEDLKLELTLIDVHEDPEARAVLMQARGRATVPVLEVQEEGETRLIADSKTIRSYLYERFGEGKKAPFNLMAWVQPMMWGLLLGGGLLDEPARSLAWMSACALAMGRAFWTYRRSRAWHHLAIGATFGAAVVSMGLWTFAQIDFPWWYVAFVVAAVVLGRALWRSRPKRAAT